MKAHTLRRRRWTAALLVGAALALAAFQMADAAKPGGGGGGSNTGGGTIYFGVPGLDEPDLMTMNSDGTNKTALPTNVWGDPGRLLHGGRRWFLQRRRIVDETYPDGHTRSEQFVLPDDGDESFTVQLTDDPTLQFVGPWNWTPAEGADSAVIAGTGRRWVFDGTDWQIDPDSVGVYVATVLFDANGNVTGLDGPPFLLVSVGVIQASNGTWYPDAYGWHVDFSPDLQEIVYSNDDRSEMRVMDVLTGQFSTITTGKSPYGALWSPAGDLIVFGNGFGGIETIRPDGSGRKEIIRPGVNYGNFNPKWSPTGSHLIYERDPGWDPFQSQVYRATSGGSGKTNLTSEFDQAWANAWR
ncbi:MAG: hypothetical protein KY476_08640 [Planctomycetes bacterium]|nr:hypothetical protein [Planctomycetota bacterium]